MTGNNRMQCLGNSILVSAALLRSPRTVSVMS